MGTSKAASAIIAIALGVDFGAVPVLAQLNLLTTREALSILDRVPDITQAIARGECPSYSVVYPAPTLLLVQARGACPAAGYMGSTLINNYIVDRTNGQVTAGLDTDGQRISSSAINNAVRELLRLSRSRILSPDEAKCLASAATEEFAASSVSLLKETASEFQFAIEHPVQDTRGEAVRFLTVNRRTGYIRDDHDGLDLMSDRLGLLVSKIISIRRVTALATEEVLSVAFEIPSIKVATASGCYRLHASDSGTSSETYIQLRGICPDSSTRTTVVAAVNTLTGRVTNPKTHELLDTGDSQRVARQYLRRREQQLRDDKASLEAAFKITSK